MAHHTLRNHRKLKRLAREIPDCPVSKLVGHLQLLWWDVYETPSVLSDGRLNGWSGEDIEAVCEWEGESGILVQALVNSEFIDTEDGVYSIHDYSVWAPDYVKKRWKRLSECPDNGGQRQISAANGGQRPPTQRNPTQRNPTKTTSSPASQADMQWLSIYEAYPRKVGRGQALKAIGKAVSRLADRPDAAEWLLGRVKTYAVAVAGQNAAYIPHPATWFNGERYFDDEADWSSWRLAGQKQDPTKVRQLDVSIYEARVLKFDDSGNPIPPRSVGSA